MRAAVLGFATSSENETIRGFDSDDLLVGGGGDDWLIGGWGADVYQFSKGDGQDTIDDDSSSQFDRLELLDILSVEASVERLYKGSETLVLSFAGTDDTITIRGATSLSYLGVEEIAFADGVVWTRTEMLTVLDNNAPVTVEDGIFSVKQEEQLVISAADLLRNDFDADGDTLRIISVDGGADGIAQINGAGDVVFTGAAGFTGSTQFEYTVTDGRNGLSTGVVSVRVVPPASAKDDFGFTVDEDGFLTIAVNRLLSNDVDGDRMIIAQVLDSMHGIATLSTGGQISFNPDPNYNGLASFRYVANTPEGGRAEATVYIDVNPLNDVPVAGNDSGFVTDENQPFSIDVSLLLQNDTDIDGDTLSVVGVVGNLNLRAELTDDGFILVTPSPYFFGNAAFDYIVSDASGATATASVSVFVTPVNDPPEPVDDFLTTAEDNPILVTAAELLANDIERDGDPLTVVSVTCRRRRPGRAVRQRHDRIHAIHQFLRPGTFLLHRRRLAGRAGQRPGRRAGRCRQRRAERAK